MYVNYTDSAIRARAVRATGGDWLQVRCLNTTAHRHGDRNPSASYNTRTGYYKCFGCGLAGFASDRKKSTRTRKSTSRSAPAPRRTPKPKTLKPYVEWSRGSLQRRGAKLTYYDYVRVDGSCIHRVVRVDLPDQPKWVRPLHRSDKNTADWYYGKGETPWQPFNVDLVNVKQPQTIYICEGEKTALDVQAHIDHDTEVAVTWQGGSKAVHKTDWSSIIHSNAAVALMPDDDQPGHDAMKQIARILKRKSYRWLTVPKQERLS